MNILKLRFIVYTFFFVFAWLFLMSVESCSVENEEGSKISQISESEIIAHQKSWAISLVSIGVAFEKSAQHEETAKEHIQRFYAFDEEKVLYKPAFASEKQFRTSYDGILSYLIGNNPGFPEDEGFALKGWKLVKWENIGIVNSNSNVAVAMGNVYFIDNNDEELQLEFTITYKKFADKQLKIVAQKMAVPHSPG